ncbi:hypothetical protein [Armatimonas sp.]|uniref:hypothetical protein n=1 Tax=Armatimonas sp. TaxID=1872638 RepID=UPI00374D4C82
MFLPVRISGVCDALPVSARLATKPIGMNSALTVGALKLGATNECEKHREHGEGTRSPQTDRHQDRHPDRCCE